MFSAASDAMVIRHKKLQGLLQQLESESKACPEIIHCLKTHYKNVWKSDMSKYKLKDKVVVITGSTGGLGLRLPKHYKPKAQN